MVLFSQMMRCRENVCVVSYFIRSLFLANLVEISFVLIFNTFYKRTRDICGPIYVYTV